MSSGVQLGREATGTDRYIAELGPATRLQTCLNLGDIHLVIMRCVQGCGSGRRYPGSVGASLRMGDLLLKHRRHEIGHGPHALADLGMTGKSALKSDIDVPVFVSADP